MTEQRPSFLFLKSCRATHFICKRFTQMAAFDTMLIRRHCVMGLLYRCDVCIYRVYRTNVALPAISGKLRRSTCQFLFVVTLPHMSLRLNVGTNVAPVHNKWVVINFIGRV